MTENGEDGVDPVERKLIIRSQTGDRKAFGQLVETYMKRAYYAALGFTGSHDDALDISQEAFARAFDSRAKLDPDRPFYPWLYQVLRRLVFNQTRDRKTRGEKLEAATGWMVDDLYRKADREGPVERLERAEAREKLYFAIEGLGEHEREVLVLKEFEDLKYKEIAELLNIPLGTVMSRLYSARKKLAKKLDGVL
jgi:RNA polymerase sigma-70 factor (ECF subfamily)